jgi:hypothetical protein
MVMTRRAAEGPTGAARRLDRDGHGSALGDARGVVYVEFLVAFVPVFVLFLAVVQLSLISVARLVVQHAATRGARAAVVVLDDDPSRYDDAARGDLRAGNGDDGAAQDELGNLVGPDGDADEHKAGEGAPRIHYGGARMAAIARAVHVPMAAISPAPTWITEALGVRGRSVEQALGPGGPARLLYGLRFHVGLTTAITFPIAPGASKLHAGEVSDAELVTVRVTHLFACRVPIAARLMCGSLDWNAKRRALSSGDGAAHADAFRELTGAPGASHHRLLSLADASFALLRAEASFPAQDAPYLYRSQRAGRRADASEASR